MRKITLLVLTIFSLIVDSYAQSKMEGIKEYKLGIYTSPDTKGPLDSSFYYDTDYIYGSHYEKITDGDISRDEIELKFYHDTLYKISVPYPLDYFIDAFTLKHGKPNTSTYKGAIIKRWNSKNISAEYYNNGRWANFEMVFLPLERKVKQAEKQKEIGRIKSIYNKL